MKSTMFTSLAFVAMAQMLSGVLAASPTETFKLMPSEQAVPNELKSQGCFKSQGNLTEYTVYDSANQKIGSSSGNCAPICAKKNNKVMGLHGDKCYCGNVYPEKDSITDDDNCSFPCLQWKYEPCGNLASKGMDTWSIYNTGLDIDPGFLEKKAETSSKAPAASKTVSESSAAPTDDQASQTTTSESTDKPESEEKKGTNVAGIAAGVVVGVVVIAAIVGGGFFYMRRKRNAEIEEEHRRNAAVNAFISGAKPPSSHGSISMSDSRLEPSLAHRRLSDGSIADNQDYSRKILRVTNA